MNKKLGLILPVLLVFFGLFSLQSVNAKEVYQVESEGSIGFTGTYVPIGTPDPVPPVIEIAKPEGTLPQTNTVTNHWLIWLGITILGFVFFFWKRNKKQNTST